MRRFGDILHELEFVYEGVTGEAESSPSLAELLALLEFKGDLKKQCVVLMGLPAAGKSTWIRNDGVKYFPGFRGYKTANSDVQLKRIQYEVAKDDFAALSKLKSEEEYDRAMATFVYVDNDKNAVKFPLSWGEFLELKAKGFPAFFQDTFKSYYASYFDMRDVASRIDAELFNDKVVKAGPIFVIDTVAAKSGKIIKRLHQTREQGYQNTVVFLDIRPDLCIVRDKYRKETTGRGVGEGVIMSYYKNMNGAFQAYMGNAGGGDAVIDRIMHFAFRYTGPRPIDGYWVKLSDDRFDVRRELAARIKAKGPSVK